MPLSEGLFHSFVNHDYKRIESEHKKVPELKHSGKLQHITLLFQKELSQNKCFTKI